MKRFAKPAGEEELRHWRDPYRQEMNCQIIHDSLHVRKGWTRSFFLGVDGVTAGYGSVAVGGPWTGKPTVFEYYLLPDWRSRLFDLFPKLLEVSGAKAIETQSNDPILTVMLHTYCRSVISEAILFHDRHTTQLRPKGVVFRPATDEDSERFPAHQKGAGWLLEQNGEAVATGGILHHYNRPFGDLYMEVMPAFRRRGLGAYMVQELKRACYEGGSVPSARCNTQNVASRSTLLKAGFVPCGHLLTGQITS